MFAQPFFQAHIEYKHQSFTSLAFAREIFRWPVDLPHKGSVTRKKFSFDGSIMQSFNILGIYPIAFEVKPHGLTDNTWWWTKFQSNSACICIESYCNQQLCDNPYLSRDANVIVDDYSVLIERSLNQSITVAMSISYPRSRCVPMNGFDSLWSRKQSEANFYHAYRCSTVTS